MKKKSKTIQNELNQKFDVPFNVIRRHIPGGSHILVEVRSDVFEDLLDSIREFCNAQKTDWGVRDIKYGKREFDNQDNPILLK